MKTIGALVPETKKKRSHGSIFAATIVLAGAACLFAGLNPRAARAETCFDVCAAACVKPWATPDRWDDNTVIPGHASWAGDLAWDCEPFTDTNGNHLYDPGEPYTDQNGNGVFDQELYDIALTGYHPDPNPANLVNPAGDLGQLLTLKANNASSPHPGLYYAIDLPPVNKGTPIVGSTQYSDNIAHCNPTQIEKGDELQLEPGNMVGPTNLGMRDLIALDPGAYWDNATQSVKGSAFALSPRIVLLSMYDPRIQPSPGRHTVFVTRVVAFFMESMTGNAEVRCRLLKALAPGGTACSAPAPGGSFLYDCATQARETTWGRLKGSYR